MGAERHLPRATYRLQLRSGVSFDEVASLADYLSELGISHVYLSPCQQADTGSTHGYDVVDPLALEPALGGADGYAAMCAALRLRGLRLVLDIVPNHMSTARLRNKAWWSVLERGRASRHAHWFDVDWDAPGADGKVLLAILGEPFEALLAGGGIRVLREEGRLMLGAQDHLLPLDPDSVSAASTPEALGADSEALRKLVERQHYRLAEFREGRRRINYRRFFDIDGLIGLRMEDERVFEETHEVLLSLCEEGMVEGLRVDHPDGMRDPERYFHRLRRAAPRAWIVVEKILARGEELPRAWPVDGTTGYDFLERVGGLFVDPRGEEPLSALHASFTGERRTFPELAREKKRLVLERLFPGERERLVELVVELDVALGRERSGLAEVAREALADALTEVLVALPVYRTYTHAGQAPSPGDQRALEPALDAARQSRPDLGITLDFLAQLLGGRIEGERAAEALARFQQLSGPLAAKGIEDTAFYCFHRLITLCEVGGDPASFGTSPAEFHAYCARMQACWPGTQTTLATHDTKRGADVRLRTALVSEIPAAWSRAVRSWSELCGRHRTGELPDRALEYLLFQTLVGAWPISSERLLAFATKAAREAKVHTSWLEPDVAYEEALGGYVRGVLGDARFVAQLEAFLAPLLPLAHEHGLAQTLLQLCAPGVPDVYQGGELWDDSLTDPDNRRPVDFALRRRLLAELDGLESAQILARSAEGLPRLWVMREVLALRRERPGSFGREGRYVPLLAHGPRAEHLVAFQRGEDVVAVAPRLLAGLRSSGAKEAWAGTVLALPAGAWRNRFAPDARLEGSRRVAELLGSFPVALLVRDAS